MIPGNRGCPNISRGQPYPFTNSETISMSWMNPSLNQAHTIITKLFSLSPSIFNLSKWSQCQWNRWGLARIKRDSNSNWHVHLHTFHIQQMLAPSRLSLFSPKPPQGTSTTPTPTSRGDVGYGGGSEGRWGERWQSMTHSPWETIWLSRCCLCTLYWHMRAFS